MAERRVSKLERIRGGESPRVLDLFSGCGGLTLGFQRAGYEPLAAIEADPDAARTHAFNFHRDQQDLHGQPREVVENSENDAAEVLDQLRGLMPAGLEAAEAVDVIVAGPPCPTFSRIGRAKLNDLGARRQGQTGEGRQTDLFMRDERNSLYTSVKLYARVLQPVAILVENVPDFMNQRGTNHGERLAHLLEDEGYEVAYTILNAASYGVPQWRDRFFLVAIHRAAGAGVPCFPQPPCSLRGLPEGSRMNRKGALRLIQGGRDDHPGQLRLVQTDHWLHAPVADRAAPDPVTVHEAIGDLPPYSAHLEGPLSRVYRYWRGEETSAYGPGEPSSYAIDMRTWPGFESASGFPAIHHLARHTTAESGRDTRVFALMQPGDGFNQAMRIAERLLDTEMASREREGRTLDAAEVEALRREYVAPYARDKFDSKWCKLSGDQPSHTLTAHLSRDTYSHIHPDSDQARMITVQEAARLQSFPDGFVFRCAMNSAFRQIGNSVPPLLAYSIAKQLRQSLGCRPEGGGRRARTGKLHGSSRVPGQT